LTTSMTPLLRGSLLVLVAFLLLVDISSGDFSFNKPKARRRIKREVVRVQRQVEIEILKKAETCTRKVRAGDEVTVNYAGKIEATGQMFDSSFGREPFTFRVGAGQVIHGWDIGFQGMCVGEYRRLIIPPEYGYGTSGIPGVIPGDSTLIFEVELLAIAE